MIYVNQKQLDQVEYILEQSAIGNHILFDVEDIRQVFNRITEVKTSATSTGIPVEKDSSKSRAKATNKAADKSTGTIADKGPTEAEKHIENLILQPTILSKKTYLESLPPETYKEVIRTYFNIVENNIFEGMEFCH